MIKIIFSPSVKNIWLVFVLTFLVLSGCDKKTTPEPEPELNQKLYLKEGSLIKTITRNEIILQANATSSLLGNFVQSTLGALPTNEKPNASLSEIKVYRLTYKTRNTDGTEIVASGAVIIPTLSSAYKGKISMISVQHGTITEESEAPSNFSSNSEAASFGSLFSALGYIIVCPDYIGYGASQNFPHPYEHRASLGSSALDLLRATKEFLKEQEYYQWDEKLYVAGYSEGGYATMCLQKKIEEEASSEFNLRASSCGAGAYDKTAFMKEVINNTTHGIAGYNRLYLWVMLTYDRIYKLNQPASYYFKEPFATQIAAANTGYSINQSFNTILTDSFKKALNDGTDKGFINAVADNDVYNWKPKTPTRLYHGNADPLVFYFNSVNAVAAMKKQGAANVELVTIPNGTHSSSVTPFLLGTYAFFTETK